VTSWVFVPFARRTPRQHSKTHLIQREKKQIDHMLENDRNLAITTNKIRIPR